MDHLLGATRWRKQATSSRNCMMAVHQPVVPPYPRSSVARFVEQGFPAFRRLRQQDFELEVSMDSVRRQSQQLHPHTKRKRELAEDTALLIEHLPSMS